MSVKKEDVVRIQHILKAIELIEKFISGIDYEDFDSSDLVQSAVTRQLENIGEASIDVVDSVKHDYEDIAWREIKGFRNIIAHECFRIDTGLIWPTVEMSYQS